MLTTCIDLNLWDNQDSCAPSHHPIDLICLNPLFFLYFYL
jgi:hypothetical protein